MRKILLIIAFLISGMGLNAQNLWDKTIIDYDGYSLRFTVTTIEPAECEVDCSTQPTAETEITIPSTVMIEGVEFSVTTVGWGAFSGCSSLTSIEIPSTVTTIGSEAFLGCTALATVTFGDDSQLTTISGYAFYYCSSLTNIEIPSTVTTIEGLAFYDCSSLTNIEIPSSVTTIEGLAFFNCSKLSNVTFGENSQLTSIGKRQFLNNRIWKNLIF